MLSSACRYHARVAGDGVDRSAPAHDADGERGLGEEGVLTSEIFAIARPMAWIALAGRRR